MQAPFRINAKRMKYKVHPITIFEVLDHHRRRRDQNRVFGLLVGRKRRRIVEVTGALTILVTINEETEEFDIQHLSKMIELHTLSCPEDQIVGLYTTWHQPDHWLAKVHQKIATKVPMGDNSLFLFVGTGNVQNRISITGFTSKTLFGICRYVTTPVELNGTDGENLGVWTLMNSPNMNKSQADSDDVLDQRSRIWKSREIVASEMQDIAFSLAGFKKYVQDQSQRREEVGWDLAAALSEVPCIPEREFESMISGSIQDLLMVDFLAKLLKVYVNIAGKIQANATTRNLF